MIINLCNMKLHFFFMNFKKSLGFIIEQKFLEQSNILKYLIVNLIEISIL